MWSSDANIAVVSELADAAPEVIPLNVEKGEMYRWNFERKTSKNTKSWEQCRKTASVFDTTHIHGKN